MKKLDILWSNKDHEPNQDTVLVTDEQLSSILADWLLITKVSPQFTNAVFQANFEIGKPVQLFVNGEAVGEFCPRTADAV